MFTGEYRHTVDEKGRLAIPARFEELDDLCKSLGLPSLGCPDRPWIDADQEPLAALFKRRKFLGGAH